MHKEDTTVLVTLRGAFEGSAFTTLEWKGRPCWVAGEIDRALGLPDNLSGSRWAARSKDYREGADGEQVTGEALDALKAAGLVGANAPSATVFYESGATLYLMASRADKARSFRWHLVDEVLPKLRERAAPIDPLAALRLATPTHEEVRLILNTDARPSETWRAAGAVWREQGKAEVARMRADKQATALEQSLKASKERRKLLAGLLKECEREITEWRARSRGPIPVPVRGLHDRIMMALFDNVHGQGMEPNMLRDSEARYTN